jgi:ABC-type transport system substrate-binding protein
VKFHDGAPLTPADVADSLLHANPNWRVRPVGDSVVIETPAVAPTLLFELAMPRNSIVRHTRNGRIEGTGPFLLQQWQPGKTASLSSSEEYWSGRPYLDSASITMGQSLRDQQLALQLGKADVVELSPDLAAHNAEAPGRARVVASSPTDLVAVVFAHNSETVSDIRVRAAIALALDRNSIQGVLLQKQGVPAASIMPGWMSGYDFLFVSSQDIGRARQLRAQARQNAPIILAYDPADALLKLIAERVALNARDAGLNVQAFAAANGDARVVRVKLPSTDPGAAIVSLVRALAGSDPQLASDVPEQWFTIDRDLMSQRWVVPVVYIPEVFGVAPTVRNWSETRDGSWRLEDVWVAQETP